MQQTCLTAGKDGVGCWSLHDDGETARLQEQDQTNRAQSGANTHHSHRVTAFSSKQKNKKESAIGSSFDCYLHAEPKEKEEKEKKKKSWECTTNVQSTTRKVSHSHLTLSLHSSHIVFKLIGVGSYRASSRSPHHLQSLIWLRRHGALILSRTHIKIYPLAHR